MKEVREDEIKKIRRKRTTLAETPGLSRRIRLETGVSNCKFGGGVKRENRFDESSGDTEM